MPSKLQNLKSAAASIHGAGETIRGTLNSTVDRHLGADPKAMEKNQAAIETGRFEMENKQFYTPHNYTFEKDCPPNGEMHEVTDYQQSVGDSAGDKDKPRSRKGGMSRFSNLLNKPAEPSSTSGGSNNIDTRPGVDRARLRKRSSSLQRVSNLSVVGE